MCDPLAGAFDSRAFRADQPFAVDSGIGEEERVATRGGRLFRGSFRAIVLVTSILDSGNGLERGKRTLGFFCGA
jgi:hypothetical protein